MSHFEIVGSLVSCFRHLILQVTLPVPFGLHCCQFTLHSSQSVVQRLHLFLSRSQRLLRLQQSASKKTVLNDCEKKGGGEDSKNNSHVGGASVSFVTFDFLLREFCRNFVSPLLDSLDVLAENGGLRGEIAVSQLKEWTVSPACSFLALRAEGKTQCN